MPGTGNVLLDAIAGIGWLQAGGDNHITYYFDDSLGFHNWTADQKTAYAAALQMWANVANINIAEANSAAAANFDENWVSNAYMVSNFGTFGGYHYFPDNPTPIPGYYNAGYNYWTGNSIKPSGYGFQILMHEIGHGLGMAHPHDTGMGTGLLPGVTSESDYGTLRYNQTLHTIMSYNEGTFSNANVNGFSYKETPMAFDVAAIQFLYGANTTFASGDNTYLLPDANTAGTGWVCIWDTGGTDTIQYDGTRNAVVDLRVATLVNGDPNAGGFVSRAGFIFGGYTIANGVMVENATGGGGNDTLTGNVGDNALYGKLGDDKIDGGEGSDTAVFTFDLSNYALQHWSDRVLVSGAEGSDTLRNIEKLQFSDGVLAVASDANPLFDTLYYLSRNADVFHAGVDATGHFGTYGWHEGRDPDAYFDTSGYLAANRDVAKAGANPLDHYDQSGWREGRDPGPNFDTTLYLLRNPDVAVAGADPLAHFLQFGRTEGRIAYQAIGSSIVNGFDAEYYLFQNSDVAAAGVDPLAHFQTNGWHEGRNPNGWFDAAGYLSHYADVAAAGVNPLGHYMQYGWREGRDPSASFDTAGYLANNPDVAAAHINPLQHYLQFGIYEGRTAVNDGVWA